MPSRPALRAPLPITLLSAALLAACSTTPPYQRPSVPLPAAYKETAPGWVAAAPSDEADRGPWWAVFGDPALDELVARVEVSNQNVAVAAANFAQAQALVRQQRAGLFPSVSLSVGATRSGSGNNRTLSNTDGTTSTSVGRTTRTDLQTGLNAAWAPDVWGRLRGAVANAQATADASQADLAAARLSAQGELATNYIALRQADAQRVLLDDTVDAYRRALVITQNRFTAGIAPKTDVLQAQTQLANAQADASDLERQRAVYEHAIAVLLGEAPAHFSVPTAAWAPTVPTVPVEVPSTLLQRRPDIAAAERRVAAYNEQIGIARSAYFPTLNLSASYGFGASRASDLFSASSALWSLGVSAAQTIFDGGALRAASDGVRAAYDGSVASYRQTVLGAFQDIEDQLAASRVYAQQEDLRRQAADAANLVEAQTLNRYRAGQLGYSDVVLAQTSALSARRALVQAQAQRQTSAVALIQALGGGWRPGG